MADALDIGGTLLHKSQHLVEFSREQIQCGQDTTVGTKIVPEFSASRKIIQRSDPLLHDLLVVDGISNINVGTVRHVRHSRVEVQDIRWGLLGVKVRVEALKQRCLAL